MWGGVYGSSARGVRRAGVRLKRRGCTDTLPLGLGPSAGTPHVDQHPAPSARPRPLAVREVLGTSVPLRSGPPTRPASAVCGWCPAAQEYLWSIELTFQRESFVLWNCKRLDFRRILAAPGGFEPPMKVLQFREAFFLMAGPAFWCAVIAGSTSCLGASVLELFSNHTGGLGGPWPSASRIAARCCW